MNTPRTDEIVGAMRMTYLDDQCPDIIVLARSLEREIGQMKAAMKGALDELINLQPHIPQSCYPGHEKFIDTHVDAAIKLLSTGTTE